jgi:hypothetical protein
MIATPNLDEILGAEVVDPNNDRVGKVGRIYLDSDRDVPTWVSVKTGLFGLAETLVPVDDANWEGQVLHVTVDKARIKDAPRVDVDQEIAPEDQQRLYSYYDRGTDAGGAGGHGSSTAGYDGGVDQGRSAERTSDFGNDRAGAGGMGAAGTGAGMGAAGMGAGAMSTSGRDAVAGSAPEHRAGGMSAADRGVSGGDEPLGGGNQNPAEFEGDEEQRFHDAGKSAGSGQLGGGNQDPDRLDGDQAQSTDHGSLGGGNQNPDQLDGGEGRMGGSGNLGGGSQNPGGFRNHDGVGASTHGGPGEFSGTGAGTPDASRRAGAEDDPGRMQPADDGGGDQQGAAMRMSGDRQGDMNDRHAGSTRSFDDVVSGQQSGGVGGSGGQGPQSGGGGMRLRRYVVTEQQTVSMPVTREEFRLERDDDEGGDQVR